MAMTLHSSEILELVEELRVSGDYESQDAVVLEALQRLQQSLRDQQLRDHVAAGFAQLERGERVRWDPADIPARIADAKLRAERGEKPADHVVPS